MPMVQISNEGKNGNMMMHEQQQRRRSITSGSLLHRLNNCPDGSGGFFLLFWSGKLVEEGVKGEARSELVYTWKEETRSCLNNLPPFTVSARRQQVLQDCQLPGQVGEEGDEVADVAVFKRSGRQAQDRHRRRYLPVRLL